MPTCSKFQPKIHLLHPPGIKMSGGEKSYSLIMKLQSECSARHAIPNCGWQIKFSNRWRMKSAWDTHSVQQTSERILARQELPLPILTSAVKVPPAPDATIAADAWSDAVTTLRIRCPKII